MASKTVALKDYVDLKLLVVDGDITSIQNDITNIEEDVSSLSGEISDIKEDIITLSGDITDISDIREDIIILSNEISNINSELDTKINNTDLTNAISVHNEATNSHIDIRNSIPSIAGLATEIYVNNSVSVHNESVNAHTDIRNSIPSITNLVPYTGATDNVDLGSYNLSANEIKSLGSTILASDSGNVLIGTTTDDNSNKLQVEGSASINNGSGVNVIISGPKIDAYYNGNGDVLFLQGDAHGPVVINDGGASSTDILQVAGDIRIRSEDSTYGKIQSKDNTLTPLPLQLNPDGGNVLIGTTDDDGVNKLQVEGDIRLVNNSGNGHGKIQAGAALYQAPLELNSDGSNVLVGSYTDDGVNKLQVVGSVRIGDNENINNGTQLVIAQEGGYNTIESFVDGSLSQLDLNPRGGNVLIGTTDDDGVNKLQVEGSVYSEINSKFAALNWSDVGACGYFEDVDNGKVVGIATSNEGVYVTHYNNDNPSENANVILANATHAIEAIGSVSLDSGNILTDGNGNIQAVSLSSTSLSAVKTLDNSSLSAYPYDVARPTNSINVIKNWGVGIDQWDDPGVVPCVTTLDLKLDINGNFQNGQYDRPLNCVATNNSINAIEVVGSNTGALKGANIEALNTGNLYQLMGIGGSSTTRGTSALVSNTSSQYGMAFTSYAGAYSNIVDNKGLYAAAAGGANSTITNNKGILVSTASPGSTITNNIGIDIENVTGATNNYAIKTGKGKVSFGDAVTAPSLSATNISAVNLTANILDVKNYSVTRGNTYAALDSGKFNFANNDIEFIRVADTTRGIGCPEIKSSAGAIIMNDGLFLAPPISSGTNSFLYFANYDFSEGFMSEYSVASKALQITPLNGSTNTLIQFNNQDTVFANAYTNGIFQANGNSYLKALSATSARIGSVSSYTQFEADGTMSMAGSATVYDDLLADITQVRSSGPGVSLNVSESRVEFTNAADLNDYILANYQISHKWKSGSNIFPHIHWEQNSNATPNWLIQYRWQRNGQAKTTAWTNYKCSTSNAFTYTSGTLNQISYGAAITPPSGYSISDIVQFRVIRDTGNTSGVFTGADGYTGNAGITGVDIHYEIDSLGSHTEYTK